MAESNYELIYVVDDEQVVARTLAIILSRVGYRTQFFYSAEACAEACSAEKPDLVIMDVVLTGMNGLEFACRMRKNSPDVPCILFSGQSSTTELINNYLCEGERLRVLPKPIRPEQMIAEVKAMISKAQEERAVLV